ncbi:cytochrome Cbb3 [Steroidobacter denitrificans]|uniref:Cytochrome Cbb3 n=1 Tax=Steroidobacter denitrificans TaxID=465721 RepID=A0A127FCH4_STEDE|nr:cytochrome Cbb3 [Steroidobacter denitrificans]
MARVACFILCALPVTQAFPDAAQPAAKLYRSYCAECHGADRFGLMGPALLPENLSRLSRNAAAAMIRDGRPTAQMPPFGDVLEPEEIGQLTDYLYTAIPMPQWGEKEIRASRTVHHAPGTLPDEPQFSTDPMNLFIVVEGGDHHVTILDGDKLEPIHRFPSRFALHGGPKFTPDGRYVFFASRDGWISKFDLWNLKLVAEVRAGINTRNAAVSGDGKYLAVANYLPHTLVILDADLNPVKVHIVRDKDGRHTSRVSAVYDAFPRSSFVAALKDVKEVWELSYDPQAPEIPTGMTHDFRYREGAFIPGFLNPRRTDLNDYLDDFFFTQDYDQIMGTSQGGKGQVVHLDGRRSVATLDLPGMPHLGSGITWTWQGRRIMATPNLKEGVVSVIDMQNWKTIKQIGTPGPGFFMRSHENSRYAWVDSMMSREHKDTLTVIDKETLEVAARLTPVPGKTLTHIEFTRDGKYALASLWEDDGAIIVFDASTLKEVKRIPAKKPVGKYNVWNKITRSEGTSH